MGHLLQGWSLPGCLWNSTGKKSVGQTCLRESIGLSGEQSGSFHHLPTTLCCTHFWYQHLPWLTPALVALVCSGLCCDPVYSICIRTCSGSRIGQYTTFHILDAYNIVMSVFLQEMPFGKDRAVLP